jgi:putative flippase GtrA
VTCPSLLRRRAGAAEQLGDDSVPTLSRVQDTAVEWLRRDDALAQFVRFVLVGGTSTVVYALLFLTLERYGYMPAHLIATVASSMLANEMHRRLTFHADERVGWLTAQVEAGSVSFVGLVATSVALGWLDAATTTVHPFVQIGLVVSVFGLIGLLRFIALRWIFRPRATERA